MSDKAKLLFFMLLTHPQLTSLGAMRATIPGLAAEMGWTTEAFREAFGEAFAKAMVEHDERACLIALPNFLKYNPPESPNVVKAWVSALDLLPECDLKNKVIQRAKDYAEGMTEAFGKAFREAFAKAMPNQKQKQYLKKEPDGSDASPSAITVWDLWKSIAGKNSGGILRKAINEYGEETVAAAVSSVALKRPADPVSYLYGVLKGKAKANRPPEVVV